MIVSALASRRLGYSHTFRVVRYNALQGTGAHGHLQQHHRSSSTFQGVTENVSVSALLWSHGKLAHECAPIHSAGRDIISRLLDKEEDTRLGSKTGASEVKQHKWFSKINWGLLRNTEPPVSHVLDIVQISDCYTPVYSPPCGRGRCARGHIARFVSLPGCVDPRLTSSVCSDHPCFFKRGGHCELSPNGGIHLTPSRESAKHLLIDTWYP